MIARNPNNPLSKKRRRGKPVHAVLFDGTVRGVFPSAAEAADALGVVRNTIFCALSHGRRACGYWWRFADDDGQESTLRAGTGKSRRLPIPAKYRPARPSPVAAVVHQGRNLDVSPVSRSSPASRWGREDAERTPADWERGRFERARAYNPDLTWESWQAAVAGEKRGRKPGWQARRAARGGKALRGGAAPVLDSGAIAGRGEM